MEIKSGNLTPVAQRISQADRWRKNGHKSAVIWLTGLSAAGKTTLAQEVDHRLFEMGRHSFLIDGDNIRRGLCRDLGFSDQDRQENIRRVGEMAALFADAGTIVITAFISPFAADRAAARLAAKGNFHEVYLAASVAACEQRDPKGLYKKARDGKLADFTGISSPYEKPLSPELEIDTAALDKDESAVILLDYILAVTELK